MINVVFLRTSSTIMEGKHRISEWFICKGLGGHQDVDGFLVGGASLKEVRPQMDVVQRHGKIGLTGLGLMPLVMLLNQLQMLRSICRLTGLSEGNTLHLVKLCYTWWCTCSVDSKWLHDGEGYEL
ncbi:hypothetical protein Hanom_Chr09g00816921 [Helianthus anomalus]